MHAETPQIPERFQRKPLILRAYEVIFGVIALGSIIVCGLLIFNAPKVELVPVLIALSNLPMLVFSYQLAMEQKGYSYTFIVALVAYMVLVFGLFGMAIGLVAIIIFTAVGMSVFKLKSCQEYNKWLVKISE